MTIRIVTDSTCDLPAEQLMVEGLVALSLFTFRRN